VRPPFCAAEILATEAGATGETTVVARRTGIIDRH
jgi:hypothetical protein